jgi:hypothetical protein
MDWKWIYETCDAKTHKHNSDKQCVILRLVLNLERIDVFSGTTWVTVSLFSWLTQIIFSPSILISTASPLAVSPLRLI